MNYKLALALLSVTPLCVADDAFTAAKKELAEAQARFDQADAHVAALKRHVEEGSQQVTQTASKGYAYREHISGGKSHVEGKISEYGKAVRHRRAAERKLHRLVGRLGKTYNVSEVDGKWTMTKPETPKTNLEPIIHGSPKSSSYSTGYARSYRTTTRR